MSPRFVVFWSLVALAMVILLLKAASHYARARVNPEHDKSIAFVFEGILLLPFIGVAGVSADQIARYLHIESTSLALLVILGAMFGLIFCVDALSKGLARIMPCLHKFTTFS